MCEGVESVGGAHFSGTKKMMLKLSGLKRIRLRKDNGYEKEIMIGCIMVLLCTLALGMTTFAAGNKTMKNKKWISGKCGAYVDTDNDGRADSYKDNGTAYYKISIPKQGYIIVDMKKSDLPGMKEYFNYWGDSVQSPWMSLEVLNSKKKVVSLHYDSEEVKKFSCGVKKGTYYLKVEGNTAYKLRYTFTPVTKVSKAGKSFAKAATIKKGAAIKNVLIASSNIENKEEHYYKLKLTKKTKVVFSCDSKIAGKEFFTDLVAQMYVKKGKNYNQVNAKGKTGAIFAYNVKGKKNITYTLPKGTYYLRVWSMGTGYYGIKWK